jgi:hypothetical protein
MDNKTIARIAKRVVSGLGWDVKLTGGNIGGTAHFFRDVSFNFYDAGELANMLNKARGEVSKIMSKSKVWKFDIKNAGVDSKGRTNSSVLVQVEVKLKFKNEQEILDFVDYLEFTPKVDKVENWIS